jgi:hypothetical protein
LLIDVLQLFLEFGRIQEEHLPRYDRDVGLFPKRIELQLAGLNRTCKDRTLRKSFFWIQVEDPTK